MFSATPKFDCVVWFRPDHGYSVLLSRHLSINVHPATMFAVSNIDLFAANCSDIVASGKRAALSLDTAVASRHLGREASSLKLSAGAPNWPEHLAKLAVMFRRPSASKSQYKTLLYYAQGLMPLAHHLQQNNYKVTENWSSIVGRGFCYFIAAFAHLL